MASEISRVDSPELLAPSSPFAHAVIDADYVHLAGIVAADLQGGSYLVGNVAKEARAVMEAVSRILASHGLGMERVVRVLVHLVDLDDLPTFDAAYGGSFGGKGFPARTAVQVGKLVAGCRVEVTVTARR